MKTTLIRTTATAIEPTLIEDVPVRTPNNTIEPPMDQKTHAIIPDNIPSDRASGLLLFLIFNAIISAAVAFLVTNFAAPKEKEIQIVNAPPTVAVTVKDNKVELSPNAAAVKAKVAAAKAAQAAKK